MSRVYTQTVGVRFTPKQLRAAKKAAKAAGVSVSTWLRMVAIKAAAK